MSQKKKIFISFSWTGMDQAVIKPIVLAVAQKLKDNGLDTYVNILDPDTPDGTPPARCVSVAIEKMRDCDSLLALKIVKNCSEGQLMEIGAAKALNIPVILFMNFEADEETYIDDPYISDQVVMWEDTADLIVKLDQGL